MAEIKDTKKILVAHLNIRQSIFLLLLKLVVLDVITVFLLVVFLYLLSTPLVSNELKVFILSSNFIYFLLLGVAKVSLTFYVVLGWLNEYYEVYSNAIVHKNGIIWRKEERYPLRQIRFVKMRQGAIGRICNFGTLELFDWDLSKYATIYLIHNPTKYLGIIEELNPKAGHEKDILREHFIREKEV